jgi:hypothetical protein
MTVSLGQLGQKLVMAVAGLLLALPLYAGEVPSPVIPKAKMNANEEFGCVEPVTEMRKNHMKFIMHQRDDTMRKGIRTSKYSLAECINCHVVPDQNGNYAHYGEDKHFCSTCHNYAAVNIDCFSCHRDTPGATNPGKALTDKSNPHHHDVAFNQESSLSKESGHILPARGAE